MRPKLLDLFCGAGGAARGYADAGFAVTGVDINPQKRYPYYFVCDDALGFVRRHGHKFDVVHASPPCQRYSVATKANPSAAEKHPDLVAVTRDALRATGKPYIIENVPGAPLVNPIVLCGTMFPGELKVYRHRLFESNIPLVAPVHGKHDAVTGTHRWPYRAGEFYDISGTGYKGWTMPEGRVAMGIGWPMCRQELVQAIPPAYTRCLGEQIMVYLQEREREEAAS